MHFRDACQPLTMVRNCYFYTEYYLMLNLLNNINIIKMFHSHIKMYRTLVIWKYASVYIRCLDIVTIVYLYILYHFVYITVIVLCFPFTFCTNNMALYIMVLYAIVYYGTTWYMQSFIYFFLYFFFIFILQCPIMPYK